MEEQEVIRTMTAPLTVKIPGRLAATLRMIAVTEGGQRISEQIARAYMTGPCFATYEDGFGVMNKEQAEAWLLEE